MNFFSLSHRESNNNEQLLSLNVLSPFPAKREKRRDVYFELDLGGSI